MNITQLHQLFLLGVTAFALIGCTLELPGAFAQTIVPATTPLPTVTTEPPPVDLIDLTVDEDLDGMPDELQAALDQLNAVYEASLNEDGTISTDPAVQEALLQAEEEFRSRLPYSEQTRAAQVRVAEVYQALTQNPDAETQAELLEELQALEVQMQSDANFALIDQILSRRLVDALNAKVEAGQQSETPAPIPTSLATPLPDSTPIPDSGIITRTGESILVQPSAADQTPDYEWFANAWTALFPREACSSTAAPDFNLLARGEIMFLGHDEVIPNFFYAKKYTHTAMYNGVFDGAQSVFEAWPGVGVRRRPLATAWQISKGCVAFAKVTGTTPTQRENALNAAITTYGTNGTTPYNFNFLDKDTNSALYCSQLVYKVFRQINNTNLDSNDATYRSWLIARFAPFGLLFGVTASNAANLMVAPDEIALHSSMDIYHQRQNP